MIASLRARTKGPNANQRVLTLTALADVDDDLVDAAAEMAHAAILRGAYDPILKLCSDSAA